MSGDRKWIGLAYLVGAALIGWVTSLAFELVIKYTRWSNPKILSVAPLTSILGFFLAFLGVYLYTRQAAVQTYSDEVVQEVRKVTWPTRQVAYLSSIVVVVTVFVMAFILGVFDWVCTAFVGWLVQV